MSKKGRFDFRDKMVYALPTMKLTNTSKFPNETVRAVIRSVCPANVTKASVRVTGTQRNWGGRAYHGRNHIIVRVANDGSYKSASTRKIKGKGYLEGIRLGTRDEALLFVAAHEFRHLWQGRVPRGWRVWGARGQYSERDADAYALRMLRSFRRGELEVKPTPRGSYGAMFEAPKPVPAPKERKPRAPWMLRTEREARKLAAEMNVEIKGYGCDVDAPTGYTFSASETHYLVGGSDDRNPSEYWERILADLQGGLTKCEAECSCGWDEEVA
jgi:hypothetical protein